MTSTLITVLSLLGTIVFASDQFNAIETARPVLLRLFPEFAHVYRPALAKPIKSYDSNGIPSIEIYNITFLASEYAQISEESLGMINAKVLSRTIVANLRPNFQIVGSRYLYRRDPKQDQAVEIELIDPRERLFREVEGANRYFYLHNEADLIYLSEKPVSPYYEVNFECQRQSWKRSDELAPSFTYHDRSLAWSARYILDVPIFGAIRNVSLSAFADIRNRGLYPLQVKNIELIAGDVSLLDQPDRMVRTANYQFASAGNSGLAKESNGFASHKTIALGEQASGIYIYKIENLRDSDLLPESVKSVSLIESNVTVKSFVRYSQSFSNSNSEGKLIRAYNIIPQQTFLPAGRWTLREQGRLIGEFKLDALAASQVYTVEFTVDSDISYRRQVTIVDRNQANETITYRVDYTFTNAKPIRSVHVDFIESFQYQNYYEMKNMTRQPETIVSEFRMSGSQLRGEFVLPGDRQESFLTYEVIIYERNPSKQ